MRHCCSQTPKTGFLASKPILWVDILKIKCPTVCIFRPKDNHYENWYCFQRPPPQTLKSDLFRTPVTLKFRARSPKSNQIFILPQCYIHANNHLVPIHPLVHGISCCQESVTLTPMLIPMGLAPKTICSPPILCGDSIYYVIFQNIRAKTT